MIGNISGGENPLPFCAKLQNSSEKYIKIIKEKLEKEASDLDLAGIIGTFNAQFKSMQKEFEPDELNIKEVQDKNPSIYNELIALNNTLIDYQKAQDDLNIPFVQNKYITIIKLEQILKKYE